MSAFGLRLGGGVPGGRHVMMAAMAGLALAIALNGVFLLYGQTADGGSAAPASLRKFSEDGQQRRLGWHAAVSVSDVAPRVATLLLLGRDGEPLKAETVVGQLRGEDSSELSIAFTPAGPNLWRAPLGALGGDWQLQVEIARPDGPAYRAAWRLALRDDVAPEVTSAR